MTGVLRPLFLLVCLASIVGTAQAQTIYPIDRASILSGQRFDLKVEFAGVVAASSAKVTVNGQDAAAFFGKAPGFVEQEKGLKNPASALLLREVSIAKPGSYKVQATDGKETATVTWEVYGTESKRVAKNVIIFIGDGMSVAHRTAARILSKGIVEGKYKSKLAMDDMPHMALIGTSGMDSIATDSANSASAYTTGHKSSVNALGVYADRTPDTLDDPRVETIAEIIRRKTKMAVGVVTDAEIEDATPASMVAHTRRRADKAEIAAWHYDLAPEVVMGGGWAYFQPSSAGNSKRKDDRDLIAQFRQKGYAATLTGPDMVAAARDPKTTRLLGLFHPADMNGALDRLFLKPPYVLEYPHQPDLTEMTQAAIQVLSRNPEGFVLMIEAGLIDKYSHPLDWERAVYDTIMLDQAVGIAKAWAAPRNDTLILVLPDHTHGINLIGTVDDGKPGELMRDKVGVYNEAGFPNYVDANGDGYPDRVDVSKRLFMAFSDFPDYYETYRPKLEGTFKPAVPQDPKDPRSPHVANPAYKGVPGAQWREGNLPRNIEVGVHAVDDGVLTATGPGSEAVHGFMDNTEVFRVMVRALALGQ